MLCSIVLSVGSQYGGERISLDVFLHKLSLTAYEHFSVLSSIPNEHTVEMEPHHQAKSYLDPNVFLNNRFIIINTDASFSDGRVGKAGIVRNRETNPTSWFQQSAALSANKLKQDLSSLQLEWRRKGIGSTNSFCQIATF